MYWGDKKYNNLNFYLKEKFGEKVYKLCVDGGFTCPNRDGKISTKGCIFCNEKGAGDFTGTRGKTIKEQAEEQIKLNQKKWGNAKYIVYFQNFTNTYGKPEYLKKIYNEALEIENVVGVAIATRPDCIDDEVLEVLKEINEKTFLWIELGLQTINEDTAILINRGYNLNCFEDIMHILNMNNIKTVIHLIVNLPNETKEDFFKSINYLSNKNIFGLKIHMLYINYNTELYEYYKKNPFYIMDMEEYTDLIAEAVKRLNKNIVIHRLTGDADKEALFLPEWIKNKKMVLNTIQKKLR